MGEETFSHACFIVLVSQLFCLSFTNVAFSQKHDELKEGKGNSNPKIMTFKETTSFCAYSPFVTLLSLGDTHFHNHIGRLCSQSTYVSFWYLHRIPIASFSKFQRWPFYEKFVITRPLRLSKFAPKDS